VKRTRKIPDYNKIMTFEQYIDKINSTSFCEECGVPLAADVCFCEQCGTPTANSARATPPPFTVNGIDGFIILPA